jgi:hypothetical protein
MEGIDTPPAVKTALPSMPGGFLGSALAAIFRSIIGRLGDGLLWGGLQVWTQFAGFIDVIASYFGASGWLSYVLDQVRGGMETVTVAGGYLFTINQYIWNLSLYLFGWFSSIVFWINLYSTMLGNFWGMLTGTYIGTTDLVGSFQLGQFFMLFLICLPLLILDRMESHGIFPVVREIKEVWGFASFILNYLGGLISSFIDLVFHLIESIPVIE